jgi:predicted DNA-binding transcriptional regulator AlpA
MDVCDNSDESRNEQALNDMADSDIVSEQNLAEIFGKHPESIKRAIQRGELPEPVPLFKRRVWTAGAIRRFLDDRLHKAQEDRARDLLRLSKHRA